MTILRKLLIDDTWVVYKDNEFWYMYGPLGQIMTRTQWETLKAKVDLFYKVVPDSEITEANEESVQRIRAVSPLPKTKPEVTPVPGYIYLIHGENTPWYKIGVSKQPLQRFKQLGAKSPFKLQTIATFKVPDMKNAETAWHDLFEFERVEGEWFELSNADIQLFVTQEGQIGDPA